MRKRAGSLSRSDLTLSPYHYLYISDAALKRKRLLGESVSGEVGNRFQSGEESGRGKKRDMFSSFFSS